MRTTNTFGVHFTTRASKQGTLAAIYAWITVDGRRIEMAIKKSIHPDNWNKANGMAKGRNDETRALIHTWNKSAAG